MLRSALAIGVASVLPVLFGAAASPAAADTAPYTDVSSNGDVTLCVNATTPLTSGSINDKPFAALAIGNTAAPTEYQAAGEKATLYAYVPRQGVDPSQWSGEIMTAASHYTDQQHPTAVGTRVDTSLAGIINELPPQWNGYYQLRLLYSAPNLATDVNTYGTADIQVTGSTWHLVRGGDVPCSQGKAVSAEENVPGLLTPSPTFVPTYINGRPNPRAFPHGIPSGPLSTFVDPDDATPTPVPSAATPSAGTTGTPAPPNGTSTIGAAASAAAAPRISDAATLEGQRSRGSSNTTAVILGVLIGLVIAGLVVFGVARVRSARAPSGSGQ